MKGLIDPLFSVAIVIAVYVVIPTYGFGHHHWDDDAKLVYKPYNGYHRYVDIDDVFSMFLVCEGVCKLTFLYFIFSGCFPKLMLP